MRPGLGREAATEDAARGRRKYCWLDGFSLQIGKLSSINIGFDGNY